ncbi:MAG: DUF3780 domain-containing protein [Chloroflexi bacterium]|nr:DUF3780 domain-containing protein [Chloroflexota bacterium]
MSKKQAQTTFGFDPAENSHHFLVNIPRGAAANIEISEHLTWYEASGSSDVTYGIRPDGQIRVILSRPKWDAIAEEVRTHFNRRLRQMGRKPGSWQVGANLVRRELGKELVLLAWAIEEADPGLIRAALANWNGLEPEERWWLYTQTAAATGHGINDRGMGWRRAVRYALTENPITDRLATEARIPDYFQRASAGPLFQAAALPEEQEEPL